MSKGSKEREDTRYVYQPRVNWRTKRESYQVLLDPDCLKAKRKR